MSDIQGTFLSELKVNIDSGDLMKAKALLAEFADHSDGVRHWILRQLLEAPSAVAIPLLAHLIRGFPQLLVGDLHAGTVLENHLRRETLDLSRALTTQSHDEKLITLSHLHQVTGLAFVDVIQKELPGNRDLSGKLAMIESLAAVPNREAIAVLEPCLAQNHPVLREAAQRALRDMGTEASLDRLCDALGRDSRSDEQVHLHLRHALDRMSVENLNRLLDSKRAELRVGAKDRLRARGDREVLTALFRNLRRQDRPDLQVHTLNLLGEIGAGDALGPIRELLYADPTDPNVRFAAYEAIANLPFKSQAHALAAGLEDADESVRVAALRAIDRHLDERLLEGIRNILSTYTKETLQLMRLLIASDCDNLFGQLIADPIFRRFATSFLATKAHPETRTRFLELLRQRGETDLVAAIRPQARETETGPLVFVVDDSPVILGIYRRYLHELGIRLKVFDRAAKMLDAMRDLTPDLIFTDLNMPETTGIELARTVREQQGPDRLPMVLVTTQDEEADHRDASQAGINKIILKPFSADMLQKVIEELCS